MMVFDHTPDVQVFHGYQAVGACYFSALFVKKVSTLVSDSGMKFGKFQFLFPAVVYPASSNTSETCL